MSEGKLTKMPFLFSFLLSVVSIYSIQGEIPYAVLEKSFSLGESSPIVGQGKEKFMLSILGREAVYSHSQANLVLKDFFTKKPPLAFKFIFKGKENVDGAFAIGQYETKTEKYRVTIHFKKDAAEYKIESIIIEFI